MTISCIEVEAELARLYALEVSTLLSNESSSTFVLENRELLSIMFRFVMLPVASLYPLGHKAHGLFPGNGDPS